MCKINVSIYDLKRTRSFLNIDDWLNHSNTILKILETLTNDKKLNKWKQIQYILFYR